MVYMKIKNEFYFSPNTLLKDLDENNVIKAFKERIDDWYFEPIKLMNNEKLVLLNHVSFYKF